MYHYTHIFWYWPFKYTVFFDPGSVKKIEIFGRELPLRRASVSKKNLRLMPQFFFDILINSLIRSKGSENLFASLSCSRSRSLAFAISLLLSLSRALSHFFPVAQRVPYLHQYERQHLRTHHQHQVYSPHQEDVAAQSGHVHHPSQRRTPRQWSRDERENTPKSQLRY